MSEEINSNKELFKCFENKYNDDGSCLSDCRGGVISSTTEPICTSLPVEPVTAPPGLIVVKVPVVLAELSTTIPIIAELKLEEKAMEIKRITKNAYITQCHIIPPRMYAASITLFIEGFIRKNIEYTTEECSSTGVSCGKIKDCTFNVPFSCTTTVPASDFLRFPIFNPNSSILEIEMLERIFNGSDPCAEPIVGNNSCQHHSISTEYFNEPIFSELISATFNETDEIHTKCRISSKDPTKQTFRRITEKCLLTLNFKILQKQQVAIIAGEC